MSIPCEHEIESELLNLLARSPSGTMDCQSVHEELARLFPELTPREVSERYRHSLSKWANRVQFVRLHCVLKGCVRRPRNSRDFGSWTITDRGREAVVGYLCNANPLFSFCPRRGILPP
ncbi:hypothetical protein HQ590_10455 [bacterium]|nr:hypothetical protein [bacterium]